jgi:hypothetical protein
MTIFNNNNHNFYHKWKGFLYEKTAFTDQIAPGSGKNSFCRRQRGTRSLFSPLFSPRFHSTTDFCYSRSATVLSDRLSRDNWYSSGLIRYQKRFVSEKTSAFHHPAKSTTEAFKKNFFQSMLAEIFESARASGLIDKTAATVSIDSSGLENHYVSRYFIMRQNCRSKRYRKWTKLTIVSQNQNHLIAGASVSIGPSTDSHYLPQTVSQAAENIAIDTLLGDSGFDSEFNHQFCHEQLGINKTVIAVNDRSRKYSPITGFWRKQMHWHFPRKIYHQRWQVESVFSRLKRRLGYALRARTNESRNVECLLKVVAYNLMVVLLTFYKELLLTFSTKQFEY